jgi:hypothetical protein
MNRALAPIERRRAVPFEPFIRALDGDLQPKRMMVFSRELVTRQARWGVNCSSERNVVRVYADHVES